MRGSSIRARRPRGRAGADARLIVQCDPDVLGSYLEDAAHYSGGHASGLVVARSEQEIAEALARHAAVLPIGAQSSLTGGATPMGELVISTSRLNRIVDIGADCARVEAGVTLTELEAVLSRANRYYPPSPTFFGAFVGGTIATNAAGAATFKYGATRDWIQSITVVLSSGDVLDIERGTTRADADGFFEIVLSNRIARVKVPTYRMPRLPKLAAGYFAEPRMDLIDLFIGSEGTLGVITEATLRILPSRPAACLAFVPFPSPHAAFAFVRDLRSAAYETWRRADANGLDVSAVEHIDARSLELLGQDELNRVAAVRIPPDTAIALLVTLELPAGTTGEDAYEQIGRASGRNAVDGPIARFCRLLEAAGVLDRVEIAVPGDTSRAKQLLALREAVPAAVNQRVGDAKRTVDDRIEKTAADMIVPFERLEELLMAYDAAFDRRGLDVAIWGHLSDGNLHPNVIPRSFADVEAGRAAILEVGREAIRLGGAPLAEHGVGRSPVKQRLLEELYGLDGIEEMRAVKRALDPEWKLAPGVLFRRSAR